MVLLLGLCGAGKSTRSRELSASGFKNFDEKVTGRPVHPDQTLWPNTAYPDLLDAVSRGRDCVVTDIVFYLPDAQRRVTNDLLAARSDVVIEWESFDHADHAIANHNCENDRDRTPEGTRRNLQQNAATLAHLANGTYRLPAGTRLLRTLPAEAD
jgi:hypothetical protein